MALSERTVRVLETGIVDSEAAEEIVTAIDNASSGVVPVGLISNAELATDVKVGSLATLTTTDKLSVVGAINELDSDKVGAVTPSVVGNIVTFSGVTGAQADSGVAMADVAMDADKPDVVSPSVVGNIVTFADVTGGQADSGVAAADVAMDADKPDVVSPSVVGNIVSFADVTGGQADSGVAATDVSDLTAACVMGVFAGGQFTTAGGDANETITVADMLGTDTVLVNVMKPGAVARTIVSAAAAAGQIDVVMSDDPSNDHILTYLVLRAV